MKFSALVVGKDCSVENHVGFGTLHSATEYRAAMAHSVGVPQTVTGMRPKGNWSGRQDTKDGNRERTERIGGHHHNRGAFGFEKIRVVVVSLSG